MEVSNFHHGKNHKISKSFESVDEANRWALTSEIAKGDGINLSKRQDAFSNFYENWCHIVKKTMFVRRLLLTMKEQFQL